MVIWVRPTAHKQRRQSGREKVARREGPRNLGGGARPYDIHRDDAYYVSSHETFESAVLKANREIMKWRVGSVLTVHIDYNGQRPNLFQRYVVYKIRRTSRAAFRVLTCHNGAD
jgi:hypothetical protein